MKDRHAYTPDPAFRARLVHLARDPHVLLGCGRIAMGFLRPSRDPVFEATPLAHGDYGHLLAYMQRRFGPPNVMGDMHRDLGGGWVLSTPHPELYLLVHPRVCTQAYSFEPLVTRRVEAEVRRDVDLPERLTGAYLASLVDLLRPVAVGDVLINAVGKVEKGDPVLQGGEFEVPVHPASCHASPPGFADTRNWINLIGLAERLGNGDTEKGLAELNRLAGRIVAGNAAEAA